MATTGTVRRLQREKGYGFIDTRDRQSFFFHFSVLEGIPHDSLTEGTTVEFDEIPSDRGPRAGRVWVAGTR